MNVRKLRPIVVNVVEITSSTENLTGMLVLLALAEQRLLLEMRALRDVELLEEARAIDHRAFIADLDPDLLAHGLDGFAVAERGRVAPEHTLEHLELVDPVDLELGAAERVRRCGGAA